MFRFALNAVFKSALVFFGSLILVGAAQAQTQVKRGGAELDPGIGGAAYVGTTGLGSQFSLTLTKHFTLLGGFDVLTLSDQLLGMDMPSGTSFEYRSTIPYAMAGWHPFGNDMRFALGLALPDFQGDFLYGHDGVAYDGGYSLSVDGGNVAPMVTGGFVQNPKGGIGFYSEAGAMFSGTLSSRIRAEDNCGSDPACQAERQTVLDTLNDAKRAVDDGLEIFPGVYPIVRFGVQVSF